jgi:hypothetical protein
LLSQYRNNLLFTKSAASHVHLRSMNSPFK